jgi:hypothetical protein
MSSKPVSIELSLVAPRSLNPTCTTSRFPIESITSHLHLPAPGLTYELRDFKQAFTGIRATFHAVVINRRPLPITDVLISGTVETERKSESFRSPQFPTLDSSRAVTFPVTSFVPDVAGPVTITAVLDYKFENAKQRVRAKEVCVFEPPLNIVARVHHGAVLTYEVRVENNKLGFVIVNVRAEIGETEFPIAPALVPGEAGAGFVVVPRPMPHLRVLWDTPGCARCFQIVDLPPGNDDSAAPITVTLGMLQPIIRCLAPFRAKITVENRAKMEISGELTIRSGPIALYGLNALQFNALAPGKAETLEGSFVALEEGRLAFPAFQVAIKEGPQFEVDAANGVFVVGSAV